MQKRIKIDVKSQGMPEDARGQIRDRLIEEYLKYPSRKVLFFVKRVRMMVLWHNNEEYLQRPAETWPTEPEDIIAQGKQRIRIPSPVLPDLTSCLASLCPSKHYSV